MKGPEERVQILADLEQYLRFMGQMGFTGLALENNPFEFTEPAPQQRPRPQAVSGPSAPAPPRPRAVPPPAPEMKKPDRAPKKKAVPNLMSIMDMVESSHASPAEETRRRAQAVQGDSKIDVLRGLYSAFQNCTDCALSTTRRCFVFGEGPPDTPIMFVGEGPGVAEDQSGRPYMGEQGQLLERIIKSMGFERAQTFITTVVKCRIPEGRTPLPDEVASCAPLLERQIETVAPRVIVSMGPTALRFFRGPEVSLMRMRGQFFQWRNIQVMPTYDPEYITRNPRSKREVWNDLQMVMGYLREGAPPQ